MDVSLSPFHRQFVGFVFRASHKHDGGCEMPLGQQPATNTASGHDCGREH